MAENLQQEKKPGRVSLKLTENVGLLDKLTLNSPRSPLMLSNAANVQNTASGGTPRTPQGLQKRKFLSARGLENASPGTPKSSFDTNSSSAKVHVRGRKIGGFRGNSESSAAHVRECSEGLFLPNLKANENDVPSTNQEVSIAFSDLLCKPILPTSLTPLVEEGPGLRLLKGSKNRKIPGDSFKRPSPPGGEDCYGSKSKRAKSYHYGNMLELEEENVTHEEFEKSSSEITLDLKITDPILSPTSKFNRSQSESALCIKSAVERIDSDPTLVGDGSRSFLLPLIDGKHTDLREISANTLVQLMEGSFNGSVESYEVIDCRYPYEYDGGHIKCAINLHTQRQVFDRFMKCKNPKVGSHHTKREILIFHCEFSSQRGPDLCRYLRSLDRTVNEASFPSLHYPELYVLYGGYKSFFEQYKEHCNPQVYLPMVDKNYVGDFQRYKSLSKTDVVQLKEKAHSKTQKKPLRQTPMKKLILDSP